MQAHISANFTLVMGLYTGLHLKTSQGVGGGGGGGQDKQVKEEGGKAICDRI